jgi:hypothetical protein
LGPGRSCSNPLATAAHTILRHPFTARCWASPATSEPPAFRWPRQAPTDRPWNCVACTARSPAPRKARLWVSKQRVSSQRPSTKALGPSEGPAAVPGKYRCDRRHSADATNKQPRTDPNRATRAARRDGPAVLFRPACSGGTTGLAVVKSIRLAGERQGRGPVGRPEVPGRAGSVVAERADDLDVFARPGSVVRRAAEAVGVSRRRMPSAGVCQTLLGIMPEALRFRACNVVHTACNVVCIACALHAGSALRPAATAGGVPQKGNLSLASVWTKLMRFTTCAPVYAYLCLPRKICDNGMIQ